MKIAKGQAFLFIFFLIIVVALLASNMAFFWQSEVLMRSLQREGMVAFYLAQAGVERAKAAVVDDVGLSGSFPSSDDSDWSNGWYTDLDLSGDNYVFRYKFNVSINGIERTIIGKGVVLDNNNKILTEKRIQMIATGIEHTSGAGTGDSKANDNDIVSWSWHEI